MFVESGSRIIKQIERFHIKHNTSFKRSNNLKVLIECYINKLIRICIYT